MINIESEEDQIFIYNETINKQLSVRQVEELARKIQDKSKSNNVIKAQLSLPNKYKQSNGELKNEFGEAVIIKRSIKGKGNIVFNFNNDKELDELIEKLLKP